MKTGRAVWVFLLLSMPVAEPLRAQSNLLANPSFEKRGLNVLLTGGCGNGDLPDWYFNEVFQCAGYGCPNGGLYASFSGYLAQNVATVPGRTYFVRFASQSEGISVKFGNDIVNTLTNSGGTNYYFNQPWFYSYCHVTAASTSTWLWLQSTQFVNVDDIMVGWLDEPVAITNPPSNTEALLGGRATFEVGAVGGPPLIYQWFKDSAPVAGAANPVVYFTNVQSEHAGSYFVIVSNHVGSVTSSVAILTVDASPHAPQIVFQPESFSFVAGSYTSVRVAAVGSPPLRYQWRFNGTNLPGGTNAFVPFSPLGNQHSGSYQAVVDNDFGLTVSLQATISVNATSTAGYLNLNNTTPGYRNLVYDVDGITALKGAAFSCQPYVGINPDQMTAMSLPHTFRDTLPGTYFSFGSVFVTLPETASNRTVYVQLRVWEAAFGSSYEEARAAGGKAGISALVQTIAIDLHAPPQITPVPSFNLRAGQPRFTTGRLSRGDHLSGGLFEWILTGASGYTYLIEQRHPPNTWLPLVILTNRTGTVTFVDSNQPNASLQFYRARMLD